MMAEMKPQKKDNVGIICSDNTQRDFIAVVSQYERRKQ